MNSAALDYFLAAYRHRSIGKACRELGLSQPALSKTIRRLEDELRVQLFERTPLGIEPTSYGHTLARRANIISNEIGRAVSEIANLARPYRRRGADRRRTRACAPLWSPRPWPRSCASGRRW